MLVIVDRDKYSSLDTIGNLYIENKIFCFTMEDVCRPNGEKIKGQTAIPFGKYKIGLRYSPKFSKKYGHDMLWIMDVPQFEYILIHPGNTRFHTEGCLLVGDKIGILKGDRAVLNSKPTYNKLYSILEPFARQKNLWVEFTK